MGGDRVSTQPDAPPFPGAAEHYRARVLQGMLSDGLPATWERRAEAFEAARPRPGDFHGRADPQALAAADERNAAAAEACRRHAQALREHPHQIDPLVFDVLAELARQEPARWTT